MKTIVFNTGRKYTAEGQVIKATLHDDNVVTFSDLSRGVDGEFPLSFASSFDKRLVLHVYDHGVYKSTKRSWEDAMMKGGCNTRSARDVPFKDAGDF